MGKEGGGGRAEGVAGGGAGCGGQGPETGGDGTQVEPRPLGAHPRRGGLVGESGARAKYKRNREMNAIPARGSVKRDQQKLIGVQIAVCSACNACQTPTKRLSNAWQAAELTPTKCLAFVRRAQTRIWIVWVI